MTSAPPVTRNSMTYTPLHRSLNESFYLDETQAPRYARLYWNGLDAYQRFIRFANIQPDESVLDVACGPGLAGLLACEVLGGTSPDVFFCDASGPLMEVARREVVRRYPGLTGNHFYRGDIRSENSPATIKSASGQAGGFDVVLVHLFLNHLDSDSRPRFIRHLRSLVSPRGRLIIQFGISSPSWRYQGQPTDEMCAGARFVTISEQWGDLTQWNLQTPLSFDRFTTMITTGDRTRGRDELREIIRAGGCTPGPFIESHDRSGGTNISRELVRRAERNQTPPGEPPRVQADYERRGEVTDILENAPPPRQVGPVELPFRVSFGLVMEAR